MTDSTKQETGSQAAAERALIRRIRAGDKAACTECIDLHSPGVYRLALRMTGSPEEAEDITQETFLNAFKAIDSFEGRSGLGTWLYRIAHNTALMRLRKKQPLYVSIDPPVEPELEERTPTPVQLFDWCCLPEQDFATSEARSELEQAIADLPETLRAVFVLRELEGLSTEETAHVLAVSVANVKVRLHRARLWLRERLSGYFTELAQRQGAGDQE
ncbi:MAG: sigma-70 family RNA polymerase sigma factor [Caldilinea sp.]|nr:sigma-70 family RNA polymerase sigma factor [Caldilinea sp.]MCB0056508.1 sigma-70 family RNA polymerase sigma factor [Caldilineaceae bacterium]MCO5209234.1 sigma-70 family RNA polymerase sigma factor [Caldilinea sp.]MCW5841856.1 sigma-70 family RNA polymerase sigma factor [Caldilinea sp.]